MRGLGRWLLWSLIVLGALAGIFRAVALRAWRVPSGDPYLEASIAPSLKGGDLILLWRFTPPALGTLVLCPEPKHADRIVIGRMLGEDRDTIRIDGTHVSINDRVLSSEGTCADDHFKVTPPQGGIDVEQRCSTEVASGVIHPRGEAEATAELANAKVEIELKPGEVALVSDNRRYPYDSRDYGPVERATCKETVFFRLVGADGYSDTSRRFQFIR
jgi:signal peptidase I